MQIKKKKRQKQKRTTVMLIFYMRLQLIFSKNFQRQLFSMLLDIHCNIIQIQMRKLVHFKLNCFWFKTKLLILW